MVRISAAEFVKNFVRYWEVALGEPVTVTRNGRDRAVLLSVEEYRRLKRLDKRTGEAGEITQEDISAMERGKPRAVPVRAGHDTAYSPLGLLGHHADKD